MKKILFLLIIGISYANLFAGVGYRDYYVASPFKTSFLKDGQMFDFALGLNSFYTRINPNIDFQTSYCLTDRYDVFLNFFTKESNLNLNSENKKFNSSTIETKNFIELGLGAYKYSENYFSSEFFMSMGYGHQKDIYLLEDNSYAGAQLGYLKLSIGVSYGASLKNIEIGGSSRLSNAYFNRIKMISTEHLNPFSNKIAPLESIEDLHYLSKQRNNLFLDQGFAIRFGLQNVKLQLQLGYTLKLTQNDLSINNGRSAIGLAFNIDKKKS
ncbi:MAG TPA: hypothetical protein PKX92_11375 [Edaphocola sp.]|nr:hypothetical protein [Edaphocola sp.]